MAVLEGKLVYPNATFFYHNSYLNLPQIEPRPSRLGAGKS